MKFFLATNRILKKAFVLFELNNKDKMISCYLVVIEVTKRKGSKFSCFIIYCIQSIFCDNYFFDKKGVIVLER